MALLYSNPAELGSSAPPFSLLGVDDKIYTLNDFKNSKALLVLFICNHCPYVIAVHERLTKLAKEFLPKGLAVIAINPNDPAYKEDDSFENMKKTAKEWGLVFPYVFDETQNVARAYGAVCTPDPFLYENTAPLGATPDFRLRYQGRIDDSWKDEAQVREQSLRLAIEQVLKHQKVSANQTPSMGCSIKWKELTAEALERKKNKS